MKKPTSPERSRLRRIEDRLATMPHGHPASVALIEEAQTLRRALGLI